MLIRDEALCRIRDVLDRIGDKWSLAVINELGAGTRRFTEIKAAVPGISQRMLTVTVTVRGRWRTSMRSATRRTPTTRARNSSLVCDAA
ncbi:hypothetical protein GCM10009839_52000 [Catenulispora yoronensis]|uniref:HTH hxlR-type domain-containing protein n=1 Tax=Catenulispora yoronensis TaxID=450799 RepID=A0ABP5GCK1_9ACTN